MDKQVHRTLKDGVIFMQRVARYPTVAEQRIDMLCRWVIASDQRGWFERIYDGGRTIEKWSDIGRICGLQEDEISRALDELTYYAKLHQTTAYLSPVKSVWCGHSSRDVTLSFERLLLTDAIKEETMGVAGMGYHIAWLINPLLYPLDYSCTYVFTKPTTSPEESLTAPILRTPKRNMHSLGRHLENQGVYIPADPDEWTVSDRYAMLPTDFDIDNDGNARVSSYINNLHPVEHEELYHLISRVFTAFVPLLEQTLTDLLHPVYTNRVTEPSEWYTYNEPCLESPEEHHDNEGLRRYGDINKLDRKITTKADREYEEWERSRTWVGPKPMPFIAPSRPIAPYSLHGRRVQAVVRMDSLVIHPPMDDAAEVATEWKIEGMANERIIATGIYFYSLSNIAQGAGISFREAIYGDFDKHNFDLDVLSKAYGLDIDQSSARTGQLTINKVLGTLDIQKDRYIVFPNTYQSRMVCLQPKDRSKPGVCKMLHFLFVDPTTPVPSSSVVVPRQQGWRNDSPGITQPILPECARAVREKMQDERDTCNRTASKRLFEPWIYTGAW